MPFSWLTDLGAVTGSPYAAELQAGLSRLRFAPELEQRYVELHLARARLRVRLWQSAVAITATFFSLTKVQRLGLWHPVSLVHVALLTPLVLLTAWVAWSSRYERIYLPLAQLTIPLNAASSAFFAAQDASWGHPEDLAVLSAQMMCIFLLSGLLFRAAALAGATLLATSVGAAVYFDLSVALTVQFAVFLVTGAIIAAGSCWGMEQTSRRSFLLEGMAAELAARDALTGLWNRRAFDRHLLRAWDQALRERDAITLLMFDVDHFKSVNDRHGHTGGDRLLQHIAACARNLATRPLDMVARYGGDEFAVLLYGVKEDGAKRIAEGFRTSVAHPGPAQHPAHPTAQVVATVTVGVASIIPISGRSADGVLQLADAALYNAKEAGRNRIKWFGQEQYDTLKTGVFPQPDFKG